MGDSTTKEKAKKKPSFFKGLKKEFKKVTWPDKQATAKETTAVVIISIIMGVIIALMDMVVQIGVDWITTL